MFSQAVRWGNRLKFWNTKPTSIRRLRISRSVSSKSRSPLRRYPTYSPSMVICPLSIFSKWLMVRSKVDLPEPDGPRITVTLPGSMLRSI
ncbi:hypothetical protein PFLmoz3_00673 [Pseudomonas fluorescens]|uniref:Uncharacterized protein n=1 Tax=Pseudomonas fluorescens TaxID=294 RepID=A0A109LLB4_PSEFL|nr:hypothetical protein PFLmoz3_00673 [Pseudomonas fluorescens]